MLPSPTYPSPQSFSSCPRMLLLLLSDVFFKILKDCCSKRQRLWIWFEKADEYEFILYIW
jgi:hypothetical protein